jgi:hypothetical protein
MLPNYVNRFPQTTFVIHTWASEGIVLFLYGYAHLLLKNEIHNWCVPKSRDSQLHVVALNCKMHKHYGITMHTSKPLIIEFTINKTTTSVVQLFFLYKCVMHITQYRVLHLGSKTVTMRSTGTYRTERGRTSKIEIFILSRSRLNRF